MSDGAFEHRPQTYQPGDGPSNFGRYQLLYKMATGGMATIYLARQAGPEQFEKLVVIKKIHEHLADDERFIEMFLDEARIAALIQHPNVATIFDLGQLDGAYYIAMEYVHGTSLRELLQAVKGKRIPWHYAVRVVIEAGSGLHAAHLLKRPSGQRLEVVHRDVSPQNILVSYDGHVKVVDFGIAQATERATQTVVGTMKGKPSYMSPEQATHGAVIDRRADIFSLGVVLWEVITQRRLFTAETNRDILELVRQARVPPPSSLRKDLPRELDHIVARATARRAADRYESCAELKTELEQLLLRQRKSVTDKKIADLMQAALGPARVRTDERIEAALAQAAEQTEPDTRTADQILAAAGIKNGTQTHAGQKQTMVGGAGHKWSILYGAIALALILGAVILFIGLSGKDKKAPGKKPATTADDSKAMKADAPPPMPAAPPMPARPLTVKIKINVEPAHAPVVVSFRGQKFEGSAFEAVVKRSDDAEKVIVEAKGYQRRTLMVTPAENQSLPVKLLTVPAAMPAPMKPVTRPRRRRRRRRPMRGMLRWKPLPE